MPEIVERFGSLHALLSVTRGLEEPRSGFVGSAEAAHSFLHGFVARHAPGDELLGAQREMQRDLVVDVAMKAPVPAQSEMEHPADPVADHLAAAGAWFRVELRIAVTVPAYWIQFRVSVRKLVRPAAVIL